MPTWRLARRALLKAVLLLAGLDVAEALGQLADHRGQLSPPLPGARDEPAPPAPLSTADIEDLVAFAGILVEGGTLAPSDRRHVVEHIEDRARRQGTYRAFYHTTVELLERLAGRRFASLAEAERLEVVTRHRLTVPDVRPSENLGPFAEAARVVRTRVVRDLVGGYYNSPAGWAVVGYAHFPGRCGDLGRYVRPEA